MLRPLKLVVGKQKSWRFGIWYLQHRGHTCSPSFFFLSQSFLKDGAIFSNTRAWRSGTNCTKLRLDGMGTAIWMYESRSPDGALCNITQTRTETKRRTKIFQTIRAFFSFSDRLRDSLVLFHTCFMPDKVRFGDIEHTALQSPIQGHRMRTIGTQPKDASTCCPFRISCHDCHTAYSQYREHDMLLIDSFAPDQRGGGKPTNQPTNLGCLSPDNDAAGWAEKSLKC